MNRATTTCMAILVTVWVLGTPTFGWSGGSVPDRATHVVNWDGSGDHATIQEALDASTNGDTIIVMPSIGSPAGVYVENIQFPAMEITLCSSDPNDPAVVATTIIDGNASESVVTFASYAPPGAVIDGFTISNGFAAAGGGICCVNGDPTIRNCVITGNSADEGGGIRVWNGNAAIHHCVVSDNQATFRGGGICCVGFGSIVINPTITCCTITGNSIAGDWTYGGGICCDSINVTIDDCVISGNSTGSITDPGSEGGGVYNSDGTVSITGCTIADNTAGGNQSYGGGVSGMGGELSIDNCTLTGNSTNGDEYYGGGGISCTWGTLIVTDSRICNNSAVGGVGFVGGGGAIYALYSTSTISNCRIAVNEGKVGGAIMVENGDLQARNCEITFNTAVVDGGGLCATEGNLTVTNCTIAQNTAALFGFGGGILAYSSTVELANAILWGDSAGFGPEIYLDYWWEPEDTSTVNISYSDVEGGPNEIYVGDGSTLNWLTGSIDADPLFVDPDGPDDDHETYEDNDFRLSAGSPCIDTGHNSFALLTPTDLDGHARILCSQVDMGAYEFGLGDYQCDQDVDLADFASWDECMTGPGVGPYDPGCEAFDSNYDFDVDLSDFAAFEEAFTG